MRNFQQAPANSSHDVKSREMRDTRCRGSYRMGGATVVVIATTAMETRQTEGSGFPQRWRPT